MKKIIVVFFCIVYSLSSYSQQRFDAAELLSNLKEISSDKYQGRRVGEEGNKLARIFLEKKMKEVGLLQFDSTYQHTFPFLHRTFRKKMEGYNLIGYLKGTEKPEEYIVLSSHHDHVGMHNDGTKQDSIYNGADDNASGTCALLAMAEYFLEHRPKHSIIFAAFDGEEMGLVGSDWFVDHSPIPLKNIILNINMDMISRNEKNEIYICGTRHYPKLKKMLKNSDENSVLTVSFGHDDPKEKNGDDWTFSSDHGPFHKQGIPFLYFGEEDHKDYHQPGDEFKNIDPVFYLNAVNLILDTTILLDNKL